MGFKGSFNRNYLRMKTTLKTDITVAAICCTEELLI
jgi:hypothetical protein